MKLWTSSAGLSQKAQPFKKLAYAAICGVHTVFFSKRRKNSSLCAHRAAAWICSLLWTALKRSSSFGGFSL